MDNVAKISVIVPVYNVEKYLDRCVQSIVDQTYTNLEIILVDDGSPDNCPAMCDAWAEKDSRIKVIHKENGGGGAARNEGLKIAAGEYIAFVDSDDYISPRIYEYLIGLFDEETDIAECGFITTWEDNADFDLPENGNDVLCCDRVSAMGKTIENKCFRQVIWNKLYRRSVVEGIFFPPGKSIDDEFWTYKAIGGARLLKSSPTRLYAYRQQDNSVMHQLSMEVRFQAIEAKMERLEYLEQNMPSLVPLARIEFLFTCLYHGQLALRYLKGEEQKQAIDRLRETVKSHPLTGEDKKSLRWKNRVWANLATFSFPLACKARNRLGIGK